MDWYLELDDPATIRQLRSEFRAYVTRHAEPDPTAIEDSVLAFSELTTNVWRHAGGPGWVSLDWSEAHPVLVVRDLGEGFPDDVVLGHLAGRAEGGRGLFAVSHLAKELHIAARRAGGAEVRVRLPVRRRATADTDVRVRARRRSLPLLEHASPDGFEREPFLLALAVELANAVEMEHGPEAAADAVSSVALGVGEQMEAEFRRSRSIETALTPEEIADCFVRLKRTIGGDFYLVEVTADRIVLGNRRCPFGDAVRRAPALCAMTSGVFGGIAAASAGEASVTLEERIAVGDPECRVTIWLRHRPDLPGARHFADGARRPPAAVAAAVAADGRPGRT